MTGLDGPLERECRAMGRHLVGADPSAYVVQCYVDAHVASVLAEPARGIDRVLLRVARWGRTGSALADAYAGLFARTGLTRSKLVLLFSIFESTAPHHITLDRVPRGGFIRLFALGLWGAVVAIAATVVFGPLHLVLGRRSGGERAGA